MAYSNSDIRGLADALLTKNLIVALKDNDYLVRIFDIGTQDDVGEDFTLQVEPKQSTQKFVFPFYIQNKGIAEINKKIIKTPEHEHFNKLSYSLQ